MDIMQYGDELPKGKYMATNPTDPTIPELKPIDVKVQKLDPAAWDVDSDAHADGHVHADGDINTNTDVHADGHSRRLPGRR